MVIERMTGIAGRLIVFLVLLAAAMGCSQQHKRELAMEEVLTAHEIQRVAHVTKDAGLFVSLLADTMISVQNGIISHVTREDNRARFGSYFNSVHEFLEWDDVTSPEIHVSGDGKSAWTIVDKRVRYTYYDSTGVLRESNTRFAWLATYEKRGDEWLVTSNVSTRRPQP